LKYVAWSVPNTVLVARYAGKGGQMNAEEIEKIKKEVAKVAHALATPIDFDQLINDGLLKKIGNSYYTENIHGLPENGPQRGDVHEIMLF
jgi:hypothetical protein